MKQKLIPGLSILIIGLLLYSILYPAKITKTSPQNQIGKLVSGFPDIPIIPESTLIDSKSTKTVNGTIYVAHWKAETQLNQTMDWFNIKLINSGWKIDVLPGDSITGDILYAEYKKGDSTLQLSITVSQSDQKTQIEIIVHPPPIEEGEDE